MGIIRTRMWTCTPRSSSPFLFPCPAGGGDSTHEGSGGDRAVPLGPHQGPVGLALQGEIDRTVKRRNKAKIQSAGALADKCVWGVQNGYVGNIHTARVYFRFPCTCDFGLSLPRKRFSGPKFDKVCGLRFAEPTATTRCHWNRFRASKNSPPPVRL